MPLEVQNNVPLSLYTTLKVGGLATYFTVISTENELVEACNLAEDKSLKIFALGGGSNVLISDEGFDGLVVLMDIKGRMFTESGTKGDVIAEIKAGEVWDDFVLDSVSRGFGGVECLSGTPGKVGASAVQNIGAYGQEVSDVVEKVRYYDLESRNFEECQKGNCYFGYRSSDFKNKTSRIITSVDYRLTTNKEVQLKYKELKERFNDNKPTVKQVRDAVLELRKLKSMLIDRSDPDSVSAGSFFKNPVVTEDVFAKILDKYPDTPNWPQKNGLIKLSAARLIENAGMPKGFIYKDGKVGLSQKHALAIINRGGARASDILEFSEYIVSRVRNEFGVKLEPEVVFVGF